MVKQKNKRSNIDDLILNIMGISPWMKNFPRINLEIEHILNWFTQSFQVVVNISNYYYSIIFLPNNDFFCKALRDLIFIMYYICCHYFDINVDLYFKLPTLSFYSRLTNLIKFLKKEDKCG